MKLSLFATAVLLASACSMFAGASTFTVSGADGSGGITATPGQTVGYGFTFSNSSGYTFLVSSQVATQPLYATNYVDFVGLNFIDELLPGKTLSQAYGVTTYADGSQSFSGLGQFSRRHRRAQFQLLWIGHALCRHVLDRPIHRPKCNLHFPKLQRSHQPEGQYLLASPCRHPGAFHLFAAWNRNTRTIVGSTN